MIEFNTFTLVELASALVTFSLGAIFYIVHFALGRRLLYLLFANMLVLGAIFCLSAFCVDNVVPVGVPAHSVPNAAAWSWVFASICYAIALIYLPFHLHFIFRYCNHTGWLARHMGLVYFVLIAASGVVWTPWGFTPVESPACEFSTWTCSAPWWPIAGPGCVMIPILWFIVQLYSLLLLWRFDRRPEENDASPLVHVTLLRVALIFAAVACGVDIVSGLMGYMGIPATAVVLAIMDILVAVALVLDARASMRQHHEMSQINRRLASPVIASILWRRRRQLLETGRIDARKISATVMFTDLANFTPLVESLQPDQVARWLQDYTRAMAHLITTHGGFVKQYLGDGILAVFGTLEPGDAEPGSDWYAENAVRCALTMRAEFPRLVAQLPFAPEAPLGMRIGINTGQMTAGTVGDASHTDFTVIGDVVNAASRLEGLIKTLPGVQAEDADLCRILISEHTLNRLGPGFRTDYMDEVTLRGQTRPIRVFRVVAGPVQPLTAPRRPGPFDAGGAESETWSPRPATLP